MKEQFERKLYSSKREGEKGEVTSDGGDDVVPIIRILFWINTYLASCVEPCARIARGGGAAQSGTSGTWSHCGGRATASQRQAQLLWSGRRCWAGLCG